MKLQQTIVRPVNQAEKCLPSKSDINNTKRLCRAAGDPEVELMAALNSKSVSGERSTNERQTPLFLFVPSSSSSLLVAATAAVASYPLYRCLQAEQIFAKFLPKRVSDYRRHVFLSLVRRILIAKRETGRCSPNSRLRTLRVPIFVWTINGIYVDYSGTYSVKTVMLKSVFGS